MTVSPVQQLDTFGPERCETLTVEQARQWCRRLARRRYENFSVLSGLLPRALRDDYAALYAFCRWADDLGDEVADPNRALELLAWWRRELKERFAGEPRHPVFVALAPTIERHRLPPGPFDDLIRAFEQDQTVTRYDTWEGLIGYCRLSADPVGRLVLMIAGEPRREDLFELSDAICTALQLTNHWQDIRRDILERDRIYIPRELIEIERFEERLVTTARQGFAPDQRFFGEARLLVRACVECTWPLFEKGEGLLAKLGPQTRPFVWLFLAGGTHVLRSIEAWNCETVLYRPRLSRTVRLALVARAWLQARLRRGGIPVSGAQGRELAEALRHCRDVTRRRARNFYYGLKLTPEPQRSALYSIYAWMRRADDLVDSAAPDIGGRRHALKVFRVATDTALEGSGPVDDPLWVALSHTASRYDLPREAFHGVLEGQLEDLSEQRYETFGQLRAYCERVALTVGLLCISIWGYRDPSAPELAVERGIAFQLTNILRDFRQDYDAGRVYLPQEDFDRHRLTPARVRAWGEPARCRSLVLDEVARARSFYDRSAPLDGMITPSCRPTLWAMTTIYHGLLQKLQRHPERIVSDHRLRLSSVRKGIVALRARRQKPAVHAQVS